MSGRCHGARRARFPLVPALTLALGVALLTPVPFLVVLLVTWLTFVWVVRPVVDAHRTEGSRRSVRGSVHVGISRGRRTSSEA